MITDLIYLTLFKQGTPATGFLFCYKFVKSLINARFSLNMGIYSKKKSPKIKEDGKMKNDYLFDTVTERVGEFIDRVVTDDSFNIRIEADDMLPHCGTKSTLKNDNTRDLWVGGCKFEGLNQITIYAVFYQR